jgi:hypothetical protein
MRIRFDGGKVVVYPDDTSDEGSIEFELSGNAFETLNPFVKELALRQLWLRAGQLVARLGQSAFGGDQRARAEKAIDFMRELWRQQTLSAVGLVPAAARNKAYVDHAFIYALVASGLCPGGHEQAVATFRRNITKQGYRVENEVKVRVAELCGRYPQLAAAYGDGAGAQGTVEAQAL